MVSDICDTVMRCKFIIPAKICTAKAMAACKILFSFVVVYVVVFLFTVNEIFTVCLFVERARSRERRGKKELSWFSSALLICLRGSAILFIFFS